MSKWSQFSVEELGALDVALFYLPSTRKDIDLPLVDQLINEIKEELGKRE